MPILLKVNNRSTLHEDEVFDSNLWSIRPFFLILQLAHKVFFFSLTPFYLP